MVLFAGMSDLKEDCQKEENPIWDKRTNRVQDSFEIVS